MKWVCTPSAGVDHFLDKIRGTGITLTSSSGAYGVTIAEHIVMMTLEIMRRRPDYIRLNWTLPHTVEKIVSLFALDFENYCAGRPMKQIVDIDAGYNLR